MNVDSRRSEQERVRWMRRRGMDPHARCIGVGEGRCQGIDSLGESLVGSEPWFDSMNAYGFNMPISAIALPKIAQGRCDYAWLRPWHRHRCWCPELIEQEKRDREEQEEINRVLELSGVITRLGPRRRSGNE